MLPGLIDNHTHVIRGGLNYNMELRWDGVRSLADAMDMLKRQVAITPPPQWVRVVGGFTEHQFAEKRLPTIDEINAVAPDTPVFLLHSTTARCSTARRCAPWATPRTRPSPPGGEIVRDANGNPTGLLLAKPNAAILYATLAKGPKLPFDYQVNSTRHFMRELNRLGVTGVIDAGGGFQNYPEDYAVIQKLADDGQLTVRIAYNLFTQKPKQEKEDFLNWTASVEVQAGRRLLPPQRRRRDAGVLAADFEDFRQPRPDMPPEMEGELEEVVRILAQNRWPWRLHATYDETISRALDVFEQVNRDIPLEGLNWFFDHAETISDQSIDRIAALGGGIAVQHRMAYQGEYFVERYGAGAAEATPPVARMLEKGVKVSAGTDATRVASYNPWVSLAWLVTGKTVGGLQPLPAAQLPGPRNGAAHVDRERRLVLQRGGQEGAHQAGQFADLIVPDRDFFACPEDEIAVTHALPDRGRRQGGLRRRRLRRARRQRRCRRPCPTGRRCARFGGYGAWGEPRGAPAGTRCAGTLRLRPAAAPAPAASTAMTTPRAWASKAADRRPARASGAHWAAPAGQFEPHMAADGMHIRCHASRSQAGRCRVARAGTPAARFIAYLALRGLPSGRPGRS